MALEIANIDFFSFETKIDRLSNGGVALFANQITGVRVYAEKIARISSRYKVVVSAAFLIVFGGCLGSHAVFQVEQSGYYQFYASMFKIPLLLFASVALSSIICIALSRCIHSSYRQYGIIESALVCLLSTSSVMMLSTPLIIWEELLNNYSFIIITTYIVMASAGLVGCLAFGSGYNRYFHYNRREIAAIPLLWLVTFGFTNVEIGWHIRPLVGWSGQTFTFFRHDKASMFDQLRCELRNIHNFGGIKLPGAGEQSDTKQWPC